MAARRPQRLEDDECPSSLLWFLAGGLGEPPAGAELRDWKRRDREDKITKGWNMQGSNFWRVLWRGVRTSTRRRKKVKKTKKEGVVGEEAAEAEPTAEEAPAIQRPVGT